MGIIRGWELLPTSTFFSLPAAPCPHPIFSLFLPHRHPAAQLRPLTCFSYEYFSSIAIRHFSPQRFSVDFYFSPSFVGVIVSVKGFSYCQWRLRLMCPEVAPKKNHGERKERTTELIGLHLPPTFLCWLWNQAEKTTLLREIFLSSSNVHKTRMWALGCIFTPRGWTRSHHNN